MAYRVAGFIACWEVARRAVEGEGRPMSAMEYVRYWDEPERTVRRHLAEFRELFPEHHWPHELTPTERLAVTGPLGDLAT